MVPVGWAKFFVCGPGNPLKPTVFGLDLDGLEPGFGNRMAIVAEHRPKLFANCSFLRGDFLAVGISPADVDRDPCHLDLIEMRKELHPLTERRFELSLPQFLFDYCPEPRQITDVFSHVDAMGGRQVGAAPIGSTKLRVSFLHPD